MAESQDKFVHTNCPRCHARLKTPTSGVGRRLPCPMCGHEIEVGGHAGTLPLRESQVYVAPPTDGEEYALQETTYDVQGLPPGEHLASVVPAEESPGGFVVDGHLTDEARAERKRGLEALIPSERPKLPPYPMFNGVLTFFVQIGAIVCWSGFSLVAVTALVAFGLAASAANSGQFGPVAGFLMALIGMVIAVVGLVAITGFLMAILQDSAAGNRVIVQWPDMAFVDWFGGVVYFVVSLVVPFCVMYAVALPFGGVFAHAWALPIGWWVLFPIVMLSTLEMQSPLAPVSPIVMRSLVKCSLTWFLFYLETGFLGLIVGGLALVVFVMAPNLFGFAVLAGVLVAAAMIYFRLLGRLAWICDEYFREEVEEDEGEEDEDAPEEGEDPPIRPTPINDF